MTERRWAGIGVLLVTLAAALVIAGLDGARVAETATMAPGVGAPVVGDCLVSLTDKSVVTPGLGRAASRSVLSVSEDRCASPDAVRARGSAKLSAINGIHVSHRMPKRILPGVKVFYDDLRAQEDFRYQEAAAGLWKPSTRQRFLTVHSRPNVDPGAPSWIACVLVAPYVEQYSGSYVGSLAEAPAPSPFGLCLAGTANDRWVSCADRHRTQELGEGTGAPMTARDAIETCRSLVARMTGMSDITAGGACCWRWLAGRPTAPAGRPLMAPSTLASRVPARPVADCRSSARPDWSQR